MTRKVNKTGWEAWDDLAVARQFAEALNDAPRMRPSPEKGKGSAAAEKILDDLPVDPKEQKRLARRPPKLDRIKKVEESVNNPRPLADRVKAIVKKAGDKYSKAGAKENLPAMKKYGRWKRTAELLGSMQSDAGKKSVAGSFVQFGKRGGGAAERYDLIRRHQKLFGKGPLRIVNTADIKDKVEAEESRRRKASDADRERKNARRRQLRKAKKRLAEALATSNYWTRVRQNASTNKFKEATTAMAKRRKPKPLGQGLP